MFAIETRRDAVASIGLTFLLVLIWITLLDIRGPDFFYIPPSSSSSFPNTPEDKALFLREAEAIEFPSPIDYSPIRDACTRHPPPAFRPGLLFTCAEQHGGVGMLRNQILKCVRYAINAGAAIVLPTLQRRNPADISDIETAEEMPMAEIFDRDAFVAHLEGACPGMRVYKRAEDFPHWDKAGEKNPLSLRLKGDEFEPSHPPEGLRFPREWRRFFDEWLAKQDVVLSAEKPVHVRMEQTFLEYPVYDDGKAFAYEFGKILSFRKDARELAARVLFELKQKFALPIDPAKPISEGAYYGAHLRLEKDAVEAWTPDLWRFSRMEDQFREQYNSLRRAGLGIVYVASGNRTVVDLFVQYVNERLAKEPEGASLPQNNNLRNMTVLTKHDLLQGNDLARLNAMSFDQQGLVDFLMMFKASKFMGVAHSSFPWTIALRRHEMSKYTGLENEGSDILRDEYSVIMGMRTDYPEIDAFATGIWP